MKRGKFVVLEGGEGAGKSTIAQFLKTQLPGAQVLFTRELGGTPLGEKIRALLISPKAAGASPETQFGLVWASRLDHIKVKIRPALEAGKLVISERFDASTYAYQITGQNAPELEPLFFEYRKLLGNTVPDLYIFLDVPPEIGMKRMSANEHKTKPLDHFEKRPLAFHKRVREGYKEFFKAVPHVVIDANRPLEAVQENALSVIRKYLRS